MKSVIVFIALMMLTRPLWPLVDYAINYDYIVDNLCENRDKPEMQCNGKCYLTKQLAEETAGKEKNPFSNKSTSSEIPQFIISEKIPEFKFCFCARTSSLETGYKSNLNSSLFISKILHPPQLR